MTYGSSGDAQDAIDNMDMNEMKGRVLKVNLARPMKNPVQLGGNRAGMFSPMSVSCELLLIQCSSLGVGGVVETTFETLGSKWRYVPIGLFVQIYAKHSRNL